MSLSDQVGIPGESHHDLIILSYAIETVPPSYNDTSYRNFNKINNDLLIADLLNQPWNDILFEPSAQLRIFN